MERCVLMNPDLSRIWSVGHVEISLSYFGVFGAMLFYFVRMYARNRQHLRDLGYPLDYVLASFLLDFYCVQHFEPFAALLIGDAIVLTFTLLVSRQLWCRVSSGFSGFWASLSHWSSLPAVSVICWKECPTGS